MSLTAQNLDSRVESLTVDLARVRRIFADIRESAAADKKLVKRSTAEDRLFKINDELIAVAKEAGVSLPAQTFHPQS